MPSCRNPNLPMSTFEGRLIPVGKDSGMISIPLLSCANREPQSELKETSLGGTTASFATSNRKSLDLAITTTEGDRVTLSATASTTAAYATYEGAVTAQAFAVVRSNELSVTIEGELSREETKDIAKAIHAYAKVTKDIMSGRMQPAEAHARELNRLDEISSLEATFTSQQSNQLQLNGVGPASQDQSVQ